VHVVDAVLLPPSALRTVVSIATGAASQFSTLVELLTAADLVTTLSADGIDNAFTVFAPTNAAFAKVDAQTIESLKKPENKVSSSSCDVYPPPHMTCILLLI
jgi:transforming growth factor-beta-induced protein